MAKGSAGQCVAVSPVDLQSRSEHNGIVFLIHVGRFDSKQQQTADDCEGKRRHRQRKASRAKPSRTTHTRPAHAHSTPLGRTAYLRVVWCLVCGRRAVPARPCAAVSCRCPCRVSLQRLSRTVTRTRARPTHGNGRVLQRIARSLTHPSVPSHCDWQSTGLSTRWPAVAVAMSESKQQTQPQFDSTHIVPKPGGASANNNAAPAASASAGGAAALPVKPPAPTGGVAALRPVPASRPGNPPPGYAVAPPLRGEDKRPGCVRWRWSDRVFPWI